MDLNEQKIALLTSKLKEAQLRLDEANQRIRTLEGILNRASQRLDICLQSLKAIPDVKG